MTLPANERWRRPRVWPFIGPFFAKTNRERSIKNVKTHFRGKMVLGRNRVAQSDLWSPINSRTSSSLEPGLLNVWSFLGFKGLRARFLLLLWTVYESQKERKEFVSMLSRPLKMARTWYAARHCTLCPLRPLALWPWRRSPPPAGAPWRSWPPRAGRRSGPPGARRRAVPVSRAVTDKHVRDGWFEASFANNGVVIRENLIKSTSTYSYSSKICSVNKTRKVLT